MSLHVLWGPTKVVKSQDIGIKWCFRCRKYLSHSLEMLDYEEPSYYDPIVMKRCSQCHGDYTLFPGREYID